MNIAVIADIHSTAVSKVRSPIPARRSDLALELLERFVRRMNLIERPDIVLVLGDIIDAGDAAGAREELAAVMERLSRLRMPFIAVRGNHDGEKDAFESVFGALSRVHDIGDVRIITLDVPEYDAHYRGSIGSEGLAFLSQAIAEAHSGSRIVVALHNPCYAVKDIHPYDLADRDAFLEALAPAAGRALIVSGHYHNGSVLTSGGSFSFFTAPALCEHPFRYAVIDAGGAFSARIETLTENRYTMPDQHLHTRFAQCNENMDLDGIAERMALFSVPYLVLTEHSNHLYRHMKGFEYRRTHHMSADEFFREFPAEKSDLDAYISAVAPYRDRGMYCGLEVESNMRGEVMLHPEYIDRFDMLIGSVHVVPALEEKPISLEKLTDQYLSAVEKFLSCAPIKVFCHPTRIFKRAGFLPPPSCYSDIIGMLKRYGIAAEINPHDAGRYLSDRPDPDMDFIRECIARGVKLSYGSDSHNMNEVGEFAFVERIVDELGVDTASVFYRFKY